MNTLINTLTKDLHDTAEALAASTEARRMMADTIAELQAENAELRAAVARLIGLNGNGRALTDRPAAHLEYDTSTWGVVYRENGR